MQPSSWLTKLTKRLCALAPGRYCIILTVGQEVDWTVQEIGQVER